MTPTIDPIVPWPVIALAAVSIVALTLWAYQRRLRGTTGVWRWFALGLRMAAVLLCVLAALRPSVLIMRKVKQTASLVFLSDSSGSMAIGDMAGSATRWQAMRQAVAAARTITKKLEPKVVAKFYRFDANLRDDPPDDLAPPTGRETALGLALEEAAKRQDGTRLQAIVVLSDGSANSGRPPLLAAQRLRSRQVPIVTVGYGLETAGASSRDLAIREMRAAGPVYVKNNLEVTGTLTARGYPNTPIEVELWAEGHTTPVDRKTFTAKEGVTQIPIRDLKWTPQTPGETKLTLKVKPKDGELVQSNNEYSSFVTVLKGGINVLYVCGPFGVWEQRFLTRALDASDKIQLTLKRLAQPARDDFDSEFDPGAYDVYIVGDLPAEYLTANQKRRLVEAVKRGAGVIMLGSRASFGAGGWASTELAEILPVFLDPNETAIEPEGGLKVIPNVAGLENYVLRLSPNKGENARIWSELPAIPGANRLGKAKLGAILLAQTATGDPLLAGQEVPKGRALAFAGETWPWARANDQSRLAHLRFWRNAILWLSHKEDDSDSQVKLTLDRRRVAAGGKLDLAVTAHDAKGDLINDVSLETTIVSSAPNAKPEKVELFNDGAAFRGSHFATAGPGDYKVTVTATRQGQTLGTASARFLVFDDDRELDNPAADLNLLKQLSETTGGKFLAPEQLKGYLGSLDKDVTTDYVAQKEVRIWDNWPFLLLFATLLTIEWWLRKRHGWV